MQCPPFFGARVALAATVIACLPLFAPAAPVINEIMYHPAGPEDPSLEWIELHNPDAAPADVSGWALVKGVDFTIPASTEIPAGGYLVIAADVAAFQAAYPSAPVPVGGWVGKLKNSGEKIALADAGGVEIDQVEYADEGDWANRVRGPLDLGHRGWVWETAADGGGASLELISPALSNNQGQNWAASTPGGTPGAANSAASADLAPMVLGVQHRPKIPTAGEAVAVSCELRDEGAAATATLRWRVDGAPSFNTAAMAPQPDGSLSATIPAQAHNTVVEFYIQATDGANARTWPAPNDEGQTTNCLYQVDDNYDRLAPWVPGSQPIYRFIMTEAERAELQDLMETNASDDSNAEMNMTFIAKDGTGTDVRYLCSTRNRGASSRNGPPNNFLAKFRSDDPWNGLEALRFNCRYIHSQVAGAWFYLSAGIEAEEAVAAQLRVNGANLAQPGGPLMYGSYARVESFDSTFTANHWPLDPNGNLYQIRDDPDNNDEGDLRYEGPDPADYQNTYFKQTNGSEDDWSDLIALTDALTNAPAATFADDLRGVLHLDQWVRYFATDVLVGNQEGGLTSGRGDDFALYSGADGRFYMVPHDLDTVLDQGTLGGNPTKNIFVYENVTGLNRFFNEPEIVQMYYATLLEMIENFDTDENVVALITRAVGHVVPQAKLNEMIQYTRDRRAGVLAQIPQDFSIASALPVNPHGYYRTTDGSAVLTGDFQAAKTLSVTVNGAAATLDQRAGTWSFSAIPGFLNRGVNRLTVRAYSGKNGTGEVVDTGYVDVWYNGGGALTEIEGTLTGAPVTGYLKLLTTDSYLPGVPTLVRVELRNDDHSINRDRWDATATLTSSDPSIVLNPSTVTLYNGRGSALVTIGSTGTGTPFNLVSSGDDWRFLDDGTNQGTGWREPAFDDSGWDSGPSELGYGDGDEATEVGFVGGNNNKNATTYFRTTFNVADPASVSALSLRLTYDDGAIAYLNGTEVAVTSNMDSGAAFDDYSNGDSPGDNAIATFNVSPSLLVAGDNVLAVEIHQGDGGSSDISMDAELIATPFSIGDDPGDLTLTATVGSQSDAKAVASLFGDPETAVSGTLAPAAGATNWSGIVHVTGDLTVPAGHTLNIAPGTLVLIDGTAAPRDQNGTDLIVQGTVNALGTEAQPIHITCSDPAAAWGEIRHTQSGAGTYQWCSVTRAGHGSRGGHTNTAPAFRVSGSALTFTDCTITDISGKIAQTAASGGADSSLTFQRCHLGRASMGPELFDTALVLEDSHLTEMLGVYREDGVVDDDDGIYLHTAGAGQTMAIRRCVVANCQDDGIDMLDGETTVEDTIIRNIADKGVSVFTNPFHISGSIITGCDIGISAKGGGTDVVPVDIDHCTIAGNTSRGIYAENKSGEPDVTVIYSVTNSIIRSNGDSVGTDYDPADITITFTNLDEAWPGAGNQTGDPLFVSAGARDFHLAEGSPAIGAGDDASDLGALPYVEGGGGSAPGEVRWTVAGGPYHIIGDTTVPVNTTLVIEPGVSVFFDRDIELDIEGVIRAIGTADARIQFTALPSAAFAADPAGNGSLPDGPPKSDGIKIIDSMSPDNIISYADIAHAQDNLGAIGVIRSQCLIDHCTFRGTHIRMVYTEDSNTIVQYCAFPNMFNEGEAADALGLDNISEHVKGVGTIPDHLIVRYNTFGTNKGHNDVIDVESQRRPDPIAQLIGNRFAGSGDEQMDLGGDVYVAENFFYNIFKDDETSDRGYANGISTGDSGPNTTINVARNVFWDVDHAINLKIDTATIFEHNTCYKIHGDFDDRFGNPNVGSAINLYVDEPGAQPGDGAYAAGNIFYQVPRVFGNADRPAGRTTPLELFDNLIEEITDITIGANHAGQTIYDLGTNNLNGAPMFADPDNGDFALLPGSPAIGASPFGQDLGALVPGGAWIAGEPPALTASRGATLRVGGPGIFSFRWKLNDGAWSADLPIGSGFDPDPGTVRSATIELADLADGTYTVFVQGQDFAGNWQDEPTASLTWTVDAALAPQALINEVFANNVSAYPGGGSYPDYVEFYNPGSAPFPLEGLTFSDDPATPARYVFPLGAEIPAGGYLLVTSDQLGFGFQSEGETVYLYDAGSAVLDSVAFGPQAADFSIGRIGHDRAWGLNVPTPGAANVGQLTGNIYDLKINEWFASGKVALTDDFIEIYNPSRLPVHVGGLFLTDHANTNPLRTQIRPLSFVGAGDVVAFWGGGGPDGLGFNLSSDIELLGLFDAGGTAIDTVFTGPQTEDYAQRRTANGGSDLEFHRLPTPGVRVPGGGSSTGSANLIAADATWRYRDDNTDLGSAWRDPAFDDSGWPSGQAALYREDSDLPAPAVKNTEVNIGTPTHYFRHAFNIDADPANVALELSLLIDDGAVVYLNGTEIYRVRVTDDPVSFSSSSGTIVNATWEGPFAIPSDALVNGENVLAVEVHQNTPASVDMVFDLILDAEITQAADDPESLAFDRALAIFDSLRVTELMYNAAEGNELDFIELQNIGAEPLDLEGVRFTQGIDFTFPAMVLQPGEYVVVVANLAEFEAKYGAGLNVAGQYAGKLDNGGETLTLQLPAPYDAAPMRFRYEDDWFAETDGAGPSLVIADPALPADQWSEQSAWAAGVTGGTPGSNLVVGAGADQAITLPVNEVSLSGSAPSAAAPQFLWSKQSGPGDVQFGDETAAATTATFSAPGTYDLRLQVTDGATVGIDVVRVTVDDLYAQWAARNGANVADPTADTDLDGVPDLVEYAFDLDPTKSDADLLPAAILENAGGGESLSLTYAVSLRKADIQYAVEGAPALHGWGVRATTRVSQGDDVEEWRVEIGVGGESAFFLRIRITKP